MEAGTSALTNCGLNCKEFCNDRPCSQITKYVGVALAVLAAVGIVIGALMKCNIISGAAVSGRALSTISNFPVILIGASSALLALLASCGLSACARTPREIE